MTRVYAEKDGNRYMISAKGHAAGSTEVCAAVSGLLYALSGWLSNAPEGAEAANWSMEPGNALLLWTGGEQAEAVFAMTVIGLLQIQEQNQRYLAVEYSEI